MAEEYHELCPYGALYELFSCGGSSFLCEYTNGLS